MDKAENKRIFGRVGLIMETEIIKCPNCHIDPLIKTERYSHHGGIYWHDKLYYICGCEKFGLNYVQKAGGGLGREHKQAAIDSWNNLVNK